MRAKRSWLQWVEVQLIVLALAGASACDHRWWHAPSRGGRRCVARRLGASRGQLEALFVG